MSPVQAFMLHQKVWTGTPTPPAPPVVPPAPPVTPPVPPVDPPVTPPVSTKPSASNTGYTVATSTLKKVVGNQYLTAAGTVLEGLDIYGFVTVYAAGCIIRNCRIRGNGPQNVDRNGAVIKDSGLIDTMAAPITGLTTIQNCLLVHDNPSVWVNGIHGHHFTATSNNIYSVVDGMGVFCKTSPDANVVIQNNYIHDLNYMSPDPEQSDGHTHNDGIQIQGSGNISILGNTIECLAGPLSNTKSPYYPACTGQGIGVTPNVSAVHDLTIQGNWLDGGAQAVTIGNAAMKFPITSNIVMKGNRFGRQSKLKPSKFFPGVQVVGMPTANGTYADVNGNVYDDTSKPINIYIGT